MIFSDEYLEHYGIKGMKWGVRNKRYGYNGMPTNVYSKVSKGSGGSVSKSTATRSYNGMPSSVQGKSISSSSIKSKAKKKVSSILSSISSGSSGSKKSGKSAAQKAKEKAEKEAAKKKKAEEAAKKKAEKTNKSSEKAKSSTDNEKLKKELAESKKAYEELLKQKQKTQISETYTKYLEDTLNRRNGKSKINQMSTDERLNKIERKKSKRGFPNRRPSGMRHFDDDASIMIFSNELLKPHTIDEEFLEHHGILGMKWGKKNGPPYPLDEGDHSAKEKKDDYKKSLGGGRNEKLYDRHRNPSKEELSSYRKKKIAEAPSAKESPRGANKGWWKNAPESTVAKYYKKEIKDAEKQEVTKQKIDNHRKEMIAYYNKKGDKSGAEVYKKATDEQIKTEIQHREAVKKALIIGGAAVGIGVAAYVIYSRKSLHDFDAVKFALANNTLDTISPDKLVKQGLSIDTANKIITLDAKKRVISDKDIFEVVKNGVLNDMDLTIKNARFQRMDFRPNFDIKKAKDPLFVSIGKEDIDKYYEGFVKGQIPNRSGAGKDTEVFQLTLDALEDIKIPSREKAKNIYADIMKLDPSFDDDMRKAALDMYSKNAKIMGIKPPKLDAKEWEMMKKDLSLPEKWTIMGNLGGHGEAGVPEYLPNMIMAGNGIAKEKISKAFKDRGFNAMIDIHDILDKVSDLPIIVLDNNALEVVKKTKHFVY